uniref:Ig-like domain-containing protein n=1 Tax=Myotis myotis TaxID=51298 RepID=A0A7J7WW81_MYOMY|nr:hypothetical protein mMyoMyo1_011983 [Myotis myotis]
MAWEAAHLLPLVLLVLLASGSWEQQPLLLRILEGEEVSIRCNYPGQQGWKTKTWCKVISAGTCTLLVTSPSLGRGPGNPRYVIRNYPRQGYFTVTMTALREDSGLYWCGFYEFSKVDILRTIRLAVSRGEGKAHHIHGISTHEDETGSDQQLGSGKDTGDIHYASFTRLDPFGLEDPIYINTRPGLRPTPDPFLAVEYASIAKN